MSVKPLVQPVPVTELAALTCVVCSVGSSQLPLAIFGGSPS